jgi:hypothetical protein
MSRLASGPDSATNLHTLLEWQGIWCTCVLTVGLECSVLLYKLDTWAAGNSRWRGVAKQLQQRRSNREGEGP